MKDDIKEYLEPDSISSVSKYQLTKLIPANALLLMALLWIVHGLQCLYKYFLLNDLDFLKDSYIFRFGYPYIDSISWYPGTENEDIFWKLWLFFSDIMWYDMTGYLLGYA